MDFSAESEGKRNVTGLSIAVCAHLVLGYAIVTGLAQHVVKSLKNPLEVSLVDEIKPPPPPPPPVLKPVVQPPKAVPPPPVYVPPPEVQTKAPVAETVTAVINTPPPVAEPTPAPVVAKAAPVEAPPAPVVVAAPVVAIGAACPNHIAVRSKVDYPAQATLRGLNGDVVVELTVGTGGAISGVHVLRSTNPIFEEAATTAVSQYLHCVAQGQEVRVRIPFNFRIAQ